MPHLLEFVDPPILSCAAGFTSSVSLGHEAMEARQTLDLPRQLGRLQSAVGRMCTNPHDGVQLVRANIDARYIDDTLGAPDDFEFNCYPNRSITSLLESCDADTFLRFVLWNDARQNDVRDAISGNLPDMQTDVTARADRLFQNDLIPRDGYNRFEATITDIASKKRVLAIDSFDAATANAMVSTQGMHISHLFDGGWDIGLPTDLFFAAGFHESAHLNRIGEEFCTGKIPPVEEVLPEHFSVVSEPGDLTLHDTVLDAAEIGSYRSLRKFFGYVLLGPAKVSPEQLGNALVYPPYTTAYQGLVRVLRGNLNALFPKTRDDWFDLFVDEYNKCWFPHDAESLVQGWLHHAERRVQGR